MLGSKGPFLVVGGMCGGSDRRDGRGQGLGAMEDVVMLRLGLRFSRLNFFYPFARFVFEQDINLNQTVHHLNLPTT